MNLLLPFLWVFITALFSACSDSESTITSLTVPQQTLTFSYESSSKSLELAASQNPDASADQDWVSLSEATPTQDNKYEITISVDANNSPDARKATITIQCSELRRTIDIEQDGKPQTPTLESNKALLLARDMHNGINIGNTLEAIGGENAWGAPNINRDYIKGIREAGFNAVRIPCSWSIYMDENDVIDEAWLDRVHEVVGMALDEDLYVVLNDHWDNGWIENNISKGYDVKLADKLTKMWTQIANKMEPYGDKLLYAGFNEPNAENQAETNTLMAYHQMFVDAVRATGGNNAKRVLVVQAPNTNIELAAKHLSMPKDIAPGLLMLEVHFYGPYNFCLMEKDENWGNTFWFWGSPNHVGGSSHNPTWGEEKWMTEQCRLVFDHFTSKGIPAILGEYGCMVRKELKGSDYAMHQKSRRYWSETLVREAKNNGMVPFNWDTPGGIINRHTGAVADTEMIEALKRGADAGKYPF